MIGISLHKFKNDLVSLVVLHSLLFYEAIREVLLCISLLAPLYFSSLVSTMASSDLFTSLLSEGTTIQPPPADSVGRGQDTVTDLGEAGQPGVASTTQITQSGAVGRGQETTTDLGEAASDHEGLMPINSPKVGDIQSFTAAMLTITRSLSGVMQEIGDMKSRMEWGGASEGRDPPCSLPERDDSATAGQFMTSQRASASPAVRETNDDSVEASRTKSLGRVPASPARTIAENTGLRAPTSEDRASLTAPASSPLFDFMAGQKPTSGPEVNENIAGIINKFTRETVPEDRLKQMEDRYLMAGNVQVGVPRTNTEIWRHLTKATQERDRDLQKVQQLALLGLEPLTQVANSLVEKVDTESSMSPSEIKDVLVPLIDCLCAVSNTKFQLIQLRRQELKSYVAPQYRNVCELTHNPVDMQWLLGPDVGTKMEEVAKKTNMLSLSISARLHPYQRPSTSTQKPFLGLARGNWKNSRSQPHKARQSAAASISGSASPGALSAPIQV